MEITLGKLTVIGILTVVISVSSSVFGTAVAYGELGAQVVAIDERLDDRENALVELYRSLDRRLGNIEAALIKGKR
jgi:hypothetical protein